MLKQINIRLWRSGIYDLDVDQQWRQFQLLAELVPHNDTAITLSHTGQRIAGLGDEVRLREHVLVLDLKAQNGELRITHVELARFIPHRIEAVLVDFGAILDARIVADQVGLEGFKDSVLLLTYMFYSRLRNCFCRLASFEHLTSLRTLLLVWAKGTPSVNTWI